MLTQEQFIRNYSVMADGEVDVFLGAGASLASGIPTGGDLIWEFKRTLYCSECGISTEKYKDLALPSTRKILQEYFDRKGGYPEQYAPEEYSFYFEQCYNDPLARKRFIESIVSDRKPSIGYLCLAEAVAKGKVKNVWTTNFDPLLENALNQLYPINNVLVCSEANRDSIRSLNPQYPVIGKLHGDYRYDWLRNTENELQQLEEKLKEYAASQMADKQLVVIGYSGNDESIMSFLESCVDNPATLSKGLLWAIRKGSRVNPRVNDLLERAKKNGKNADILEIDGFDQLLFSVYQMQNYHNEVIDGQSRMLRERSDVRLSGRPVDSFVKLNAYRAEGCPLCNVFETDITRWKELRAIIGSSNIIAGLFSKHIYALSSADKLRTVFGEHILSSISKEEAPEMDIRRNDSVYIGLVYRLIKHTFLSKGMISFAKNKVYNPDSCRSDKGYQVFDALEIAVSFIDGNLYLNLMPTVHVRSNKGERLDIHKTTPFIREEITGIMQAFSGIEVELVQIQDYCSWRGIRFGADPGKTAYGFPVKRGMAVKLDRDSFLLWTHGCVIHPELSGPHNYYKGSRGIPAPLLIRRFAGNASGDTLVKEILMLTKMNWNSGDSLYKTLPVTLDFAKVLARMSKQEEAIFDKAYDFRFFM